MRTQLSKPARGKASYTEEYKREALELWRASGRSAAKVAAELGIRPPLLYRWAQLERESSAAQSEPKSRRSMEALEAEVRRLRAEKKGRPGSNLHFSQMAGAFLVVSRLTHNVECEDVGLP
jgi:transposase